MILNTIRKEDIMAYHVMLDVETLGSAPNGLILSLGGCRFSDIVKETFYINILDDGKRKIDYSTVTWWLKQSKEAQEALFNPAPIELSVALLKLSNFVNNSETIWANGVTFDLSILRDAYNQCGIKVPWSYKQEMCLRPILFLGQKLGIVYGETKREGTQHNALEDAKYQAEYLIKVLSKIGVK